MPPTEDHATFVCPSKNDCFAECSNACSYLYRTFYYRTYKSVNRTRRQTKPRCCHGWSHLPGSDGCTQRKWPVRAPGSFIPPLIRKPTVSRLGEPFNKYATLIHFQSIIPPFRERGSARESSIARPMSGILFYVSLFDFCCDSPIFHGRSRKNA